MEAKRLAAEKAVEYIEDGMVVGLGTGTTAYWAIQKIGERVGQGLRIRAIASSARSEQQAKALNIPLLSQGEEPAAIDIDIDGADEVDNRCNLLKGGGGALLREKIIARNSRRFLVVVDEHKLVRDLGQFPLPVEIVPFASGLTLKQLEKLGVNPVIRQVNGQPFRTDNGNLIADCRVYPVADPAGLNTRLHSVPGVVETGLFPHTMVSAVIVGYTNGEVKIIPGGSLPE
jgi:ribose 5-phosphate isomerase A